MVLAAGCCHPVGEAAGYDGLYLKRDEMASFASALRGKPIYVEHDASQRVGTVAHAWATEDDALHVLFETDEDHFAGHLAANLIKSGVCHELSLGHDVSISQSADGPTRVTDKTPNEVSLVVKGARANTRIHAWGRNTRSSEPTTVGEYICHRPSDERTMDEPSPTPPPTEPTAEPTAEPTNDEAPTSVINELRQQAEAAASFKEQLEEMKAQLSQYQQVGQKRRTEALGGAVKDWFENIIKSYPKELGEHSAKFQEIFKAMAQNEEAEPMVQLLSCAASNHRASTVALEQKYQTDRQNWEQETKRLKSQLQAAKPAFAEPTERFKPSAPTPPPTDAYNRMFGAAARGSGGGERRGGGMRTSNPGMWNAMMQRASTMPNGGSKQTFDTSLYSKSDERLSKIGF